MQSRTPKIQEVNCHYAWSQGLPKFKRLIAILFVCLFVCVFWMKIVRLLTDPAIHGLDFAARRQNADCSFGLVHHINCGKSQREPSEPLDRPRIKSPPSYTKTTSTAYRLIRPMCFQVAPFGYVLHFLLLFPRIHARLIEQQHVLYSASRPFRRKLQSFQPPRWHPASRSNG